MLINMHISIDLGVSRHQNTANDICGGSDMVYVILYAYTGAGIVTRTRRFGGWKEITVGASGVLDSWNLFGATLEMIHNRIHCISHHNVRKITLYGSTLLKYYATCYSDAYFSTNRLS